MGYLISWIISGCICGAISRYISKNKGYEGGFAWGFFLGLIGIIVVACKRDLNYGDPMELQPRWICTKCSTVNLSSSKFCTACGESQPGHWLCKDCSTSNPSDGRFCQNCGKEKAL